MGILEIEGGLYLINLYKKSLFYLFGSLFKALYIKKLLLLLLFIITSSFDYELLSFLLINSLLFNSEILLLYIRYTILFLFDINII